MKVDVKVNELEQRVFGDARYTKVFYELQGVIDGFKVFPPNEDTINPKVNLLALYGTLTIFVEDLNLLDDNNIKEIYEEISEEYQKVLDIILEGLITFYVDYIVEDLEEF